MELTELIYSYFKEQEEAKPKAKATDKTVISIKPDIDKITKEPDQQSKEENPFIRADITQDIKNGVDPKEVLIKAIEIISNLTNDKDFYNTNKDRLENHLNTLKQAYNSSIDKYVKLTIKADKGKAELKEEHLLSIELDKILKQVYDLNYIPTPEEVEKGFKEV